jgi:hypothetical protein
MFEQYVIVLSREWKKILYNPKLFHHQYKGKLNQPNISSAFSMPLDDVSEITSEALEFHFIIIKISLGR